MSSKPLVGIDLVGDMAAARAALRLLIRATTGTIYLDADRHADTIIKVLDRWRHWIQCAHSENVNLFALQKGKDYQVGRICIDLKGLSLKEIIDSDNLYRERRAYITHDFGEIVLEVSVRAWQS